MRNGNGVPVGFPALDESFAAEFAHGGGLEFGEHGENDDFV